MTCGCGFDRSNNDPEIGGKLRLFGQWTKLRACFECGTLYVPRPVLEAEKMRRQEQERYEE